VTALDRDVQARLCLRWPRPDRIGPTWVFNCGKQTGPIPCHIIIDTAAREVAWFSLAGVETAHLDQPQHRAVRSLDDSNAWHRPKPLNPDPRPA
jgi:hypothetical protein